jgi:hypothetical protein
VRLAFAGAVVALVVAVTASADAGQDVHGDKALVIGDSILALSENQVRSALQADGWNAVVHGIPGATIEDWVPLVPPLASVVRPSVAVVELGTNDCNASCPVLAPSIDAIMRTLVDNGAGAVLWLNVQTTPVYPRQSEALNYQLEQAAVRWPQLQLVDFAGLFGAHPDWHLIDGFHPNATGSAELGLLIRLALHRWSPTATGATR